jgi:hypothetical protein
MRRFLIGPVLLSIYACVGDAPPAGVVVTKDASTTDQASPIVDAGAESSVDAVAFDPTWTLPLGSKSNLTSVAVDPNGDVYVAGTISEAFMLGNVSLQTAGGDDGFLMKLDGQTKQPVWAKTIAGPGDDGVLSIAFDTGALYVVGTTNGIQVTAGTTVLTIPTSNPNPTAPRSFFAKFDPSNGAPVWLATPDNQRDPNQNFTSSCPSIAVSAKKIVIACTYFGPGFGYGLTATNPINNTSSALGILAFNDGPNPTGLWTKSLEGNNSVGVAYPSVAFDANHDVWLLATLQGQVYLDDLDTSKNLFVGSGPRNPFVLKLSGSSGAPTNTFKSWPGGAGKISTLTRGIAVSGTDVFIGGAFLASLGFDTPLTSQGSLDGYAARLDPTSLATKWGYAFGGPALDFVFSVAPAGNGGAYLAIGWNSQNLMFGSTALPTPTSTDAAIASLDANGSPRTALVIDSTNGVHYGGLVTTNYIYGVGGFSGSATFDDGTKAMGSITQNSGNGFFVRRAKF